MFWFICVFSFSIVLFLNVPILFHLVFFSFLSQKNVFYIAKNIINRIFLPNSLFLHLSIIEPLISLLWIGDSVEVCSLYLFISIWFVSKVFEWNWMPDPRPTAAAATANLISFHSTQNGVVYYQDLCPISWFKLSADRARLWDTL